MKNHVNKILIITCFALVMISIYIFNNKERINLREISDLEAQKLIENAISDNHFEKINDQALIISDNNQYMIMVVHDEYILIDKSKKTPKIHHYKSNKPDIKVEVLKIENDRFLVRHDDHKHWVEGRPGENVKIGDFIFIKDPHSYLQERKSH